MNDSAPIKLTTEQFEALAIVAPATTADDIWQRLLEHGLSRGGRPRKTGRAAQPVSGPVTLAELGLNKGFLTRCRKLAAIPKSDFEELLAAFWRDGRKPSAAGLIRTYFQDRSRRRPASLERMASILREAGWTVIPPPGEA
jgi:hypothetical protein